MVFSNIYSADIPENAFLNRFVSVDRPGAAETYVDCFVMETTGNLSFEQYVYAFYTSRVFKIERLLLSIFGGYASSDDDARRLANGSAKAFAAWRVDDHADEQLLLCDVSGRTCSWLMLEKPNLEKSRVTRLLFGSAVLPVKNRKTGAYDLGPLFRALLGFHKLYSRVLLWSARTGMRKQFRSV